MEPWEPAASRDQDLAESQTRFTIDLMLALGELASNVLTCRIHDMEHGSDHAAIEKTFDVDLAEHVTQPRLLFKNVPWNAIC